jgi:hypothetical protein
MLGDAIRNMKLDRRLVRRRGWIDEDELAAALEALPDVADKVAPDDAPDPDSAEATS